MKHRFLISLFLIFFSANSIAGVVLSSEMMTSPLVHTQLQNSHHANMPASCHHDMMIQDQSKQQCDKHEQCSDCQLCFTHVILNSSYQAVSPPLLVFEPTLATLVAELVVSRLNRPPRFI